MADSLQLKVILDMVDKASAKLRSIVNGGNSASQALRAAQTQLKKLEGQQKSIAAHRGLEASLSRTSNELLQERKELQAMHAAMQAVENPTAKMTRQLDRQLVAVKKLAEKQRSQRIALRDSRAELAATGVETGKLAQHEKQLAVAIESANRKINQQQAQLGKLAQMQRISGKLTRGGMLMTAHGAGAWALKDQFAAPGKTMLTAYAEQETAASQLRASMMGANGAVSSGYDKILSKAQELGNRLPGTTAELIQMFTMLKRQGMSDQVILGGLGESAAYLGAQLQLPYTEAAEFAAKLQDATRTSEGDMIRLADTIQRAFYLGVDSDNMLAGFVKLSPAMDVLRVRGLEATKVFSPLLVMLDQMGMKGEQSGNALRKVFQKTMDTGRMADINKIGAVREAGIKFDFTNGKGEFGGLDKMFKQLQQMRALNTEDRLGVMKAMFGDDAETLQAVSALIDKGQAGYAEVQRKLQAQASLQERVNVGLGTLSALWESATGTFRNALGAFGEAAAPQIKELTAWLGRLSEKVMAWAKANPGAAAAVVKLSLGAGALLAVLGAILVPVGLLVGAAGHLASGWATLGTTFAGSGIAVGGLVTPLLLIAGAGLLVWRYWEPIKAFLGGMWDGFVTGLQPVMPVLSMLGDTLASIFAPADASEESLSNLANIGALVGQVLGGIATAVLIPLGLALQGIATVIKFVGERIGATIGFVVTGVSAFGTLLKGIFTLDGPTILAGFQAIWQNLNQYFGGLPSKLAKVGINMVQGLVNGILSMLGAPGKALAKVADSAIGKLRGLLGIKSPSRVFAQLGGHTMAGFTQGLLGGQGAAQNALQRIGAGLRTAGAGLALGASGAVVASPALQGRIDNRPPPAPAVPPMLQARISPKLDGLPALQARVVPHLEALSALQARVAPQFDELPALQSRIDNRPPLAAQGVRTSGGEVQATYNITINAAPGSDERMLARLVREELEALEHRRRVRYRSEMSDYE